MKFYSIFDDFGDEPVKIMNNAGVDVTVHPAGVPRPDFILMREIFETYDGVIIGTSQKMGENMFININSPKVIATASVGLDHICIPKEKKELITVLNTPRTNAQSVAEYTIGCALACCKRLVEGHELYIVGENNKSLSQKPEDLYGRILGVVGAGNISKRIMEYGEFLGMDVLCWTARPEVHTDLKMLGVRFVSLDKLMKCSDVVSVNIPNNVGTKNIISSDRVNIMKENAIFISVSRKDVVDINTLFDRAKKFSNFYVCLDIDVDEDIVNMIPNRPNILVTPHIAGGTISTRKRMFLELAEQIIKL